jgi:hypothetical protein
MVWRGNGLWQVDFWGFCGFVLRAKFAGLFSEWAVDLDLVEDEGKMFMKLMVLFDGQCSGNSILIFNHSEWTYILQRSFSEVWGVDWSTTTLLFDVFTKSLKINTEDFDVFYNTCKDNPNLCNRLLKNHANHVIRNARLPWYIYQIPGIPMLG